jgi:hypothetical protein
MYTLKFDITIDGQSFQKTHQLIDLNAANNAHRELLIRYAHGKPDQDHSAIFDAQGRKVSGKFPSYDLDELFSSPLNSIEEVAPDGDIS